MRYRSLIICYLFIALSSIGQTRAIDSLQNILKKNAHDTVRILAMVDLGWEYMLAGEFDKARRLAQDASRLAREKKYPEGESYSENFLGVLASTSGDLPEALEHYSRYADLLRARNDTVRLYVAFNNIGRVYKMQGNYVAALKNYLAALKIMERHNKTKEIAGSYNNVGGVYMAMYNYPDALRYYTKATEVAKQTGNTRVLLVARKNMGSVYFETGQHAEALKVFEEVLREERVAGLFESMATTYSNLGTIYTEFKNYPAAHVAYDSAMLLNVQAQNAQGMMYGHKDIGKLLLKEGKLTEAEVHLEKAVKMGDAQRDKQLLSKAYETLAELYSRPNTYEKAFNCYRLHIVYSDSLVNEENTKKIVQEEMNFEFEKKQAAQRAEQEKKDAVAEAEIRRQRVILWSISVFGLLVLGFAVFAYRSFLQKKKANAEISLQKHLIEEKQKEILDSIYYARRIQRSLLPNEKYLAKILSRLQNRISAQ